MLRKRLIGAIACLAACGEPAAPDHPPASIVVVSGDAQNAVVGEALQQPLVVRVNDAGGRPVSGVPVNFRVTSGSGAVRPAADTTAADGTASTIWTLGVSTSDESRVVAQAAGVNESVLFRATTQPSVPATLERATELGCAVPGPAGARDIMVRVLDRYGNPVPQTTVRWRTAPGNGTVSATSSSSAADGRATIRWTADQGSGDQLLVASADGVADAVFTLRGAMARELAVGATLLLTGSDAQCNDLPATNARYLVALTNTNTTPAQQLSFVLSGGFDGPLTASAPAEIAAGPAHTRTVLSEELFAEARAHEQIQRNNLQLANRVGPHTMRSFAAAKVPPPNLGDTVPVRIIDPITGSCAQFNEIRARVVHAGTRAILLEDVAAPLAGTVDTLYRALGREFDEVMWPLLNSHYGDALAWDEQLDANERLFMVFTERVNRVGVGGYVLINDFLPRSSCTASNVGEFFYARVPTDNTSAEILTPATWYRRVRTYMMHEAKHLVHYATVFTRTNGRPSNASFEERWLEEATAMLSEELWARQVFGYTQHGNVGYMASVFCELRPAAPSAPQCAGRPRSLYDHFTWLHDYQAGIERLSPIGEGTAGDITFYGSAWALLRWAIDHSGINESAFLRQLTMEPTLRGTANLSARAGRPFADLITDFGLALALDDRAGVTPVRAQLAMPSWNLPDMFAGLNSDFPGSFSPAPMAIRRTRFGPFSATVNSLRGGTSAVFEFFGTPGQTGRQVIELRNAAAATPPGALRMTIVRIQ